MARYSPEPTIETRSNYVLSEADRDLIHNYDFRLVNNLWMLREGLGWLADFPEAKKLISNIEQFERYFKERRQAIMDTLPRLAASSNPDLRAVVVPLTLVAEKLNDLAQALGTYPERPSADGARALLENCRTICDQIKPLSDEVGNNPAHRAYAKYIKESNLEAGRVTLDFELEYGEEAA